MDLSRSRSPLTVVPHWRDHVPQDYKYPWRKLFLPQTKEDKEAQSRATEMKDRGNESFRKEDYYDALWKYEHARLLCSNYSSLRTDIAVIHSNVAAACLKLGDTERRDLLDPQQYSPSYFQPIYVLWYAFANHHASKAIKLGSEPKIKQKAFYRRGVSLRRMTDILGVQNTIQTMDRIMPGFFPSQMVNPYHIFVSDFVHCFELQENSDPKFLCDALILAVNHGCTKFLPLMFKDKHIDSGFTSRLLSAVIDHDESTRFHINYLFFKIKIDSRRAPNLFYNASKVTPSQLLKKSVEELKLYKLLIDYGMPVMAEDIAYAVHVLPDSKHDIIKLLVSNCRNPGLSEYENASEVALKSNKKQFISILSEVCFHLLDEEGDDYFQQDLHSNAFDRHIRALGYTSKYNNKEHKVVALTKCIKACLKLQKYSDAYKYCTKLVTLDPLSSEGYFHRAEALKGILSSPLDGRPPGTYKDVISDYVECHKIHSNLEAFFNAVTIGHKYEITELIPHVVESDVQCGLSTQLLKEIVGMQDMNEALLKYVVFELPQSGLKKPYDARRVDLVHILSKSSDYRLIECLLMLGMSLKQKQMETIVLRIPPEDTPTFELLLKCAIRNKFSREVLTAACVKAIDALKLEFIPLLIDCGATPPTDRLQIIMGSFDNTAIRQYLDEHTISESDVQKLSSETLDIRERENTGLHPIKKSRVEKLNSEAKRHLEDNGDHVMALELYFIALGICNQQNLTEDATSIHSKCADLLLQTSSYYLAYRHADACMKVKPSHEVYIVRAEALKKMLQSGRYEVPATLTYEQVIVDYFRAHELIADAKAIMKAILVAIDHGHEHLVQTREFPPEFCLTMLMETMSTPECKEVHLEFFVNKVWNNVEISVSKVTLQNLIIDKAITSTTLLRWFLDRGLSLSKEDVKIAMTMLMAEQLDLFKLIVAKCKHTDLDELCIMAACVNRTTFVINLVEQGASLPCPSSELLLQALRVEDYDGALALVKMFKTKGTIGTLNLASLMNSNIIKYPDLIKLLITSGVALNEIGGKTPIAVIMGRNLTSSKTIDMLCLLVDNGEDCNHLCQTSKTNTTPLHVATELALKSGDLRLINSVIHSQTFNRNHVANDKGESPLHLAVKSHWKKDLSTKVLSTLLKTELMDPLKKDHSKSRPIDRLSESDNRASMLKAASRMMPSSSQQKKKQKKHKTKLTTNDSSSNENQKELDKNESSSSVSSHSEGTNQDQVKQPQYMDLNIPKKVEFQIKRLMAERAQYFLEEVSEKASSINNIMSSPVADEEAPKKIEIKLPSTDEARIKNRRAISDDERDTILQNPEAQKSTDVVAKQNLQPSEDISAILAEHVSELDIDQLSWEVEGTAKVVKFFKDRKNSSMIREAAAKTIYQLAEGKRNENLSKRVSNEKSLQLYEARITQAARILWEKAITYSAKLTGLSPIPVYSEVIRVWEIVLDHDNLERRIKYCTKQIEESHLCGAKASVKFSLLPQMISDPKEGGEKVRGKEKLDYPMQFSLSSVKEMNSKCSFIPAANTKDDEYNVTTFYSFDTINFKSMLLGINDRRDFPFKEWHKEHEIIKLTSREAILLLGRSGTGKTTCCLYRLWNEFKNFWNPESNTFRWKIPRRRLIPPSVLMVSVEDNESKEDQIESGELELSAVGEPTEATKDASSMAKSKVQKSVKFEDKMDSSPDECDTISTSTATLTSASQEAASSPNVNVFQVDENVEITEEDLHQVFITKNYVLCDQMKKRFYNMSAAFDFLDQHIKHEMTDPGNDLSKVDDYAFPLFLTSRQFYILLDNSLCDGKAFFKRDAEGNLRVKITSLDYDHEDPDILLDLEQSDSEEEEMEGSSSTTMQSLSKGHTERWTEVTALYFKEFIWPTISHQCDINSKDFDPLLVWIEIQSFIKGSESALRKGTHLSLEEYKEIGNRMAPNFSSHRDTIYEVFLKYQKYQQNQRHHNYLFDECDLVLNLHNRLKDVPDVPWSIHSLYIDEVQDFTQAELAIFVHCCRNPNSMFFTGDTAQSIMRGVAFRFQDLRSSFHKIHSKISKVNVPQKPYSLTINFRSHSGILNVAGSIIDLISEFFKDSIDHLPDDEGMFPGPYPVLLESCEIDDLALLLSSNKREVSTIEFGAHQVILVQSKEAKDNLPSILKGAIVLTIFEAKGLEFDDVLLYNFFTDSMVDEKAWRVVSSYLKKPQHREKIFNPTKLPGSSDDPRSHQFDPKLHKSLNSELKYLYTAVTRTKCNLWIYDSDPKSRLPMFDYWHKRGLVKVVQKEDQLSSATVESQDKYILVFASNSTPDQWKAQGENFKKKHLWEQAILCYQHAGPENEYLAKEARAYHLIQQARHQRPQQPQLYLEAALSFLECDELHHNLHYINAAAICLRNAKPPKYHEAAKLFERLNKFEKAAQCYLKGKDIDNYARLKESVGQHGEVIRTLMGKPFMRKRDALAKASEYENQGIKLHQDLSTSELSYSCAKFYSQRGDKDTLIEVLAYMPEASKKVKFLKEGKLYSTAFETLVENKELRSAYRLASAQSSEVWLQEGLRIAEENKDEAMRASFIFQIAKVEYKKLLATNQQDNLNPDVVEHLHILLLSKEKLTKAQAYLLLGMLKRDVSHCRIAWRIYQSENHKVGTLEAFKQVLKLSSETDHSKLPVIDMCHVAKEAGSTLMRARDINKVVKEAVSFYGLQKVGTYYYTPPGQDIWIGEPLAKCVCKSNKTDLDGMLRVEVLDARDEIAEHCKDFKNQWLSWFNLQRKLEPKMTSFPLHKQLQEHHNLLRGYSMKEVSTEALYHYLQTCLRLLELRILEEESVHKLIDLLVSVFTPRVYFYLPQRMENRHITMFRESVHCQKSFQHYIKERVLLSDKSADSDGRVKVDTWLAAWRALCVIDPSMKSLQEELQLLESKVNKDKTTQGYKHPPGFIHWDKDKRFYHIFSLWLKSCTEMRENGNFLWASKLTINQFLGHIAQYANECSLQVMNAVDILSIYCTGLLAVLAHINTLQQRFRSYTLPFFYKSNVYLFSLMNSWKKEDRYVLSACADEVNRSTNLKKLFGQCRNLLVRALDIILGTGKNAPHYSVLNIGLKNFPSKNATKQCLILALVLFGNLSMLHVREIHGFFQKIQFLLQRFIQLSKENIPQYISTVYEATKRANFLNPIEVFKLVRLLLQDAQVDSTLAQLVFNKSGRHSKIMISPIRYQQKHAQILQSPESSTVPTFVLSASQSATSDGMATATTVVQNNGIDEPTSIEPTSIEPTSTGETSDTTSQLQNDQNEGMSESIITLEVQQFIGSLHDEDEAELAISPSEYEAGFKFDVPEDIEEEQTQQELEDEQDEDMSISLTSGNDDLLSQINPDLIDPEMINPNYCNTCGVSLKSDSHSEPSEQHPELGDETATKEVYHTHVTSEIHRLNILLYRKLVVDNELYASLRHSFTSILQDYKECNHDTDELDRSVDDIQEELEKSDTILAELEEKCSWRNAIDEVSRIHNLLDIFMKRSSERLSQVIESSKQPQYRTMDSVEDNVDDVENIIDQLGLNDLAVKTKKGKRKL